MQKQSVWVLWIGSAAMWWLGSGWIETVGRAVFVITLVAHLVEFFVKRSVFERAGGSMGHHFAQTMIYGLFHWKPIEEQLAASPPAPDAGA